METAGNFGVLKEEIKDLRESFGELKIRADAAELRIAENEDVKSLPETCEGNSMMDFVENLIREKLDVSGEIPIERAHRATGHLTGQRGLSPGDGASHRATGHLTGQRGISPGNGASAHLGNCASGQRGISLGNGASHRATGNLTGQRGISPGNKITTTVTKVIIPAVPALEACGP
ncbi:hypothetical protein JOQ06_029046 [Pogonophryne albipinna]|uniref:Uncharacterized protein n=1 Tax=Pogonophryne albipinna TaxID=1090488 RepID=A0AAD6BA44_9TELE|nr:hypothetical protein JOQ06_029046 [Pogonophryne albipinna]